MSSRYPISTLRNWLRYYSAIDALAQSRTTVVRCTSCASLASLTSCKKAALIVAVGWGPTFAIDARRVILGGNFALAVDTRGAEKEISTFCSEDSSKRSANSVGRADCATIGVACVRKRAP